MTATVVKSPVLTDAERSLRVALLLTAAGGFLDAFTYVGHGRVFANAMTANVIFLASDVASLQWRSAIRVVPTLLAFMVGVLLAFRLRHPRLKGVVDRPARVSLLIEIVFLAIIAFLPASFPNMVLVPTIALVAAMQNSSFTSVESWSYNSVVTTGNLRRLAECLGAALIFKTDPSALRETGAFGAICLCFAVGAGVGWLATPIMHNFALWVPIATLSIACALCWSPRE
jgi:uncharacterized membrane protein YoaK (UPF0700 family)